VGDAVDGDEREVPQIHAVRQRGDLRSRDPAHAFWSVGMKLLSTVLLPGHLGAGDGRSSERGTTRVSFDIREGGTESGSGVGDLRSDPPPKILFIQIGWPWKMAQPVGIGAIKKMEQYKMHNGESSGRSEPKTIEPRPGPYHGAVNKSPLPSGSVPTRPLQS